MFSPLVPHLPSPAKETDDLIIDIDDDAIKLIAWRIDQLVLGGSFDTSYAGKLAAISTLDYREANELRSNGATQQQVLDLLL